MVELVLWSFVVALTPVTLSLIWTLISGAEESIERGLSWAFESAESRTIRRPLNVNPPSGPSSMAGRTPCPGTGRSWASNHRGRS